MPEIEKLYNDLYDGLEETDLTEASTWHIKIIKSKGSPKSASPMRRKLTGGLKPEIMQHEDGSFCVPLMTCSDQVKYIRLQIQETKIQIRKPTSTTQSPGFIEDLIRHGNCEVFQETKNLLTMKKCLSREEVFKQILSILEVASNDDDSFLLSFRLLAALLIKNQNNALAIFEKINGIKRLEQLLRAKV